MKAVMLSIQPKWCELIASGKKTVEVRKTKPKIDVPFKCYIYCTKNTKANALRLYTNSGYGRKNFGTVGHWRSGKEIVDVNPHLPAYRYNSYLAEGKVIGEFVCDKVDGFTYFENCVIPKMVNVGIEGCLTLDELAKYFKGNSDGYAWHISDLVIYDKPRELSGFFHYCGDDPKCDGCEAHYYSNTECGKEDYCCSVMDGCKPLKRPPQSWCYVEKMEGD